MTEGQDLPEGDLTDGDLSVGPAQKKAPPKSARRRARELAMQGIYQWLLSAESAGVIEAHIAGIPGFPRADKPHFDALLYGVIREAQVLRDCFTRHLDRPPAELSPVEHAVLLIGSYELMFRVEVPYRVAINEAVELAKSFGGTDGFKYVNGVLDKVAAELRATEISARRN
jgi:N utilization substance protein B